MQLEKDAWLPFVPWICNGGAAGCGKCAWVIQQWLQGRKSGEGGWCLQQESSPTGTTFAPFFDALTQRSSTHGSFCQNERDTRTGHKRGWTQFALENNLIGVVKFEPLGGDNGFGDSPPLADTDRLKCHSSILNQGHIWSNCVYTMSAIIPSL